MATHKLCSFSLRCLSVKNTLTKPGFVQMVTQSSYPTSSTINLTVPARYSSYRSSKTESSSDAYTNVEISTSPLEWKFVERLLPPNVVPQVVTKPVYPSGWTPPSASAADLPYYVARTKNHMMPLYLQLSYRGMRKITQVRRCQGDIWALEKDLKDFLGEKSDKKILSQVHEVNCYINIRGDHVDSVREWMIKKGF